MNSRFNDTGESIYSFFENYDKLIECPDCQRCIILKQNNFIICCNNCGYLNDIKSMGNVVASWGKNEGICYNHKLWLRIPCCGEELWAFNKEHLEYLEGYITSKIRSRKPNINQSVASRLPTWMKESKNKLQISRAIEQLKKRLRSIDKVLFIAY
ncbi:hypothetical protein [Paenibacillus lemnae]|uniref:Uncharacterized protein n=1 Tax=Paenibacillus lemnae TaxID=1330551 RepID=A0A848M518_PAELE|nr:hypothetical protein [Paenibacillus lemnae]NMO95331.1 hypothetical protein [Paenibacillus lemnae]